MALPAPSNTAVIVNTVICGLSFLGGAGIVLGYFFTTAVGGNRLRQRVVLGLGIADLIQAIVIITAFLYQTTTVVNSAWTATIALITFMTLVYPLSPLTAAFEHHLAVYIVWGIVWMLGIVPAVFGAIFFDSVDSTGGICWYRNGSLQSKLMIFVPRAVALSSVIVLYGSLFIYLRRRDLSLLHMSSDSVVDPDNDADANGRRLSLVRVGERFNAWRRRSSTTHVGSISEHLQSRGVGGSEGPWPPRRPSQDRTRGSFIHIGLNDNGDSSSNDESAPSSEFADLPARDTRPTAVKRGSTTFEDNIRMSQPASHRASVQLPRIKRLSARQINRRLSLLMMLYPIAYLLLFSVSVGRLISQLVSSKPAHPALTNISRWLVFGQGFVDGALYFVIEYLFRRSTRGRT
ncbi:hypothetical protein OIV83_000533 [Microbotryomycetes sp. JL201]|nr:hypothetical protein OIV83_000533 [Microbotryomycetes sp. JL201]